mgnify:CR=1 FL=1
MKVKGKKTEEQEMQKNAVANFIVSDSQKIIGPPGSLKSLNNKMKGSFPAPVLSINSLRVLEKRYLKKNEDAKVVEKPKDLFLRVAKNIASADLKFNPDAEISKTEEEFYHMMANLNFIPNSPTLMNAGRELQQLSACFVLPIEDSMESIFETIKDTALIHKSGGGTGFSFSRLRPANSPVASTNGVSSGPISFMKVFDSATEAIKQGGTRRGANMGVLRIDHPDIEKFITCKQEDNQINNFNISVALTDEFMKAVIKKQDYNLYNPNTGEIAAKLSAEKVFKKITSSAWKNGDPGIIFIDRINDDNPTPKSGNIESTNPCGEQPLLPYESCNLGSINLSTMLKERDGSGDAVPASGEEDSCRRVSMALREIDFDKLSRTIHRAVHFLDNVIEMNKFPLEKIELMTKANRKIGLGVMGFADMLIKLGLPYNSEDAIKIAEEVMSFINKESKKASALLAEARSPFPNFEGSIYDKDDHLKLRNATTTTIAPTGTISIIANCSSGIEPIFAVSYVRTVMDNDELIEVHPLFEQVAKEKGFYSDDLMKTIAQKGHLENIPEVPEDVAKLFVTAHNVTPEDHIKMQAAFQKSTDNAVSKTVNFANSATKEDVRKAYMLAYVTGCKGVTIYRDGSRLKQVLTKGTVRPTEQQPSTKITPRPRPRVTHGITQLISTGCGNLYLTTNECDNGIPFEIFTQMGKAGGCAASQLEAIGRLVSLSLRSNIEPDVIVKQLRGISCHQQSWENGQKILSCADAIGKAMHQYLKRKKEKPMEKESFEDPKCEEPDPHLLELATVMICPDCNGGNLEHADGCLLCRLCGYSKCG